jgi:hypothetical protein
MCTSENCQWCGNPYFAVAAIPIGEILPPQIPRQGKHVTAHVIRALWIVSLMLALNRLLLNREYVLINALKALVSIDFMCNLHVILLSTMLSGYLLLFTNGMILPFNVRRESGGLFR